MKFRLTMVALSITIVAALALVIPAIVERLEDVEHAVDWHDKEIGELFEKTTPSHFEASLEAFLNRPNPKPKLKSKAKIKKPAQR